MSAYILSSFPLSFSFPYHQGFFFIYFFSRKHFWRLTQHALSSPGVVVPGPHSVLDMLGNRIGVHVFNTAVHRRSEVRLTCCCCPNDVSHLKEGFRGIRWRKTDGGVEWVKHSSFTQSTGVKSCIKLAMYYVIFHK